MVSGGSGNQWVNTSLEIIPTEDINAIAIGPDCPPVLIDQSTYYFFDNLLLTNLSSFDLQIVETNHPCDEDFSLSVPNNSAFDYQWYLDGVALPSETFSELLQNYGEGSYQVRILDGTSCRASTDFEVVTPVIFDAASVTICEGETFSFGGAQLSESGIFLSLIHI